MKYNIKPTDTFEPSKPFNPHQNCSGHKMSFLEDPMTTGTDRLMMLRILDNYFPQG